MSCSGCNKDYEYRRGHNTKEFCGSCLVNRRRFKKKKELLEYKGGKCQVCGYNKCKSALCFHHVDPLTKSFAIGGNHTRKWIDLIAEADKCVLVCANCHMEIHEGIIDCP